MQFAITLFRVAFGEPLVNTSDSSREESCRHRKTLHLALAGKKNLTHLSVTLRVALSSGETSTVAL